VCVCVCVCCCSHPSFIPEVHFIMSQCPTRKIIIRCADGQRYYQYVRVDVNIGDWKAQTRRDFHFEGGRVQCGTTVFTDFQIFADTPETDLEFVGAVEHGKSSGVWDISTIFAPRLGLYPTKAQPNEGSSWGWLFPSWHSKSENAHAQKRSQSSIHSESNLSGHDGKYSKVQ
jgi:hypothetical protein